MFTGRRAYPDAGRDTPPSKPSAHVSGLSPAVERAILQCLEADPAARPRSPVAVLAGLPGGDPLAAALAAGETPNPQMVADGGEVGLIRPWVGGLLLAVVAVELVSIAWLYDRAVFRRLPLPIHPEALAHQAREILRELGVDDAPGDTAAGFLSDRLAETYAYRKEPHFIRGEPPAPGGPTPVYYFYRRGPDPLTPHFTGTANGLFVSDANPPPVEPGMAGVSLDPAGRLLGFTVVPRRVTAAPPDPIDWQRWIGRAGLDPERFEPDPTGPARPPPAFCTTVLAWRERGPDGVTGCRIEAGAAEGRPIYFRVTGPWHGREVWGADHELPAERSAFYLRATTSAVLVALLVLAGWNALGGRADLRTAASMAAVLAAIAVAARALAGWHASGLGEFFAPVLGWAAWIGLAAGVFYLGIEPTVRRRWPWRLTGWVRLFAGRVRDPLVGRDVLVGLTAGLVYHIAYNGAGAVAVSLNASGGYETSFIPMGFGATTYGPAAPPAVRLLGPVSEAVGRSLMILGLALLLFLLIRRERIALTVLGLFFLGMATLQNWAESVVGNALQAASNSVFTVAWVLLLARFGLLAVAASAVTTAVVVSPLTLTLSAWYFGAGATTAIVILALAAGCAHTGTGGRLFQGRRPDVD